jgi:hypothetical protein
MLKKALRNSIGCRSRREEAQIPTENQARSEPPDVCTCFFNGLLTKRLMF